MIKSDIFDHLIASVSFFDFEIYEGFSGNDNVNNGLIDMDYIVIGFLYIHQGKSYLYNGFKNYIILTKAKLKEQIVRLPKQCSIDDLVERLILIEKIETGMLQSEKLKLFQKAN